MITLLSPAARKAKTEKQIALLDIQLTREFSKLPADTVHIEVASISERLLAQAHFTDHVAVLTGRFASERLKAIAIPSPGSRALMKALVYHGPGAAGMGVGARPDDHRADRRDRPDRLLDDLRHRPAHPQGRRARDDAGDDPRPRGGRHGRRGRRRRHHDRARRPRARLLHHLVRPLPLLQGRPLRPLHRRRRLDLRPPDRRPPGRVRARAVRRHLRLQGARRASPTSRCCSSPTSSRPRTRSASSTAASSRATPSRSSAPARSGSPRS